MSVFAMTFAYNEDFFLSRWVAYYASQLGPKNLFILDHGSTDLSTQDLGLANIIKVPRSNYDEVQRIFFASHFHAALLQHYKAGYVVDTDEFLVADPEKYTDLKHFALSTKAPALACVGLDLCHVPSIEPAYEESMPILSQRRHVIFDSWMCKRSFARTPVRFGGGFHTSDQPVQFDEDLYLFHLKNFDYSYRLFRQGVTAAWDYAGDYGVHARKSLDYVDTIFEAIESRIASGNISFEFNFQKQIEICLQKTRLNPSKEYDFNVDGGFQTADVYFLPPKFLSLF